MSAHKSIDRICIVITVITLVITCIFCNGQALGIQTVSHAAGYENRLFDHERVHTIDIVINDWDGFIAGCESEEYSACNVVIDGEAVKNVGIRAKGNTSLSSVRNMNSSRYSFKIEFDQYETGKSYHGLDKLCLNNMIQDNTFMKDYLAYTLMYDFRVDAPLCSYAYITVNGEDWGLYLAVEAVENSFLERNYGSNYGDLYKPDALGFGGGRGNGKDFSMGDFMNRQEENEDQAQSGEAGGEQSKSKSFGGFGGGMPDFGGEMPDFGNMPDFGDGMPDFGNMPDFSGEMPDFGDFDPSKIFGGEGDGSGGGKGGFGGFGMGSDDVKLKYTDDSIDSYSNIFNNAKTAVDTADQKRLIRALKALLEQSDLENTVDVDEVLRYFVVHIFLCNGDSYTGQMIHNYYLYEEDGQHSMIPWDYNLAYGSFMGGNASSSVNAPIDTPVSGGMSDRPMVSWIFDQAEYTEQYHQLFREFLDSVDFEQLVADTAALIDKYVEKDPTKFCTYEEFKTGVETISRFCTLREESVSGQLNGSIPATTEGQKADSSALIDTDGLNTSDMGSMGGNGGFGGFGGRSKGTDKTDRSENSEQADRRKSSGKPDASVQTQKAELVNASSNSSYAVKMLGSVQVLANEDSAGSGRKIPGGGPGGGMPDFGGQPPQGFGGEMPADFDPDNMPDFGGGMPGDFDPGNMPEGFSPFGGNQADDGQSDAADGQDKDDENASGNAKEGSGSSFGKGNSAKGGERPDMGGFSPMNGAPARNNTSAYILLGVSVLVLLLGLGIALKFKR